MSVRHRAARVIARLTGTHFLRSLPLGVDLGADCRRRLPAFSPTVVFDVGAHAGESALTFARWFPRARVYSFEPAPAAFATLEAATRGCPRISAFQVAMGRAKGTGRMEAGMCSSMSRLVDMSGAAAAAAAGDVVEVDTLDAFCAAHDIDRIDFLKIDTEGHDLAVLCGADGFLGDARIDLIEVEAGMNPENLVHVPFEDLRRYLADRSYRLFAIYDQREEWPTGEPHMRRCNAVFISARLVRQCVNPQIARRLATDAAMT